MDRDILHLGTKMGVFRCDSNLIVAMMTTQAEGKRRSATVLWNWCFLEYRRAFEAEASRPVGLEDVTSHLQQGPEFLKETFVIPSSETACRRL